MILVVPKSEQVSVELLCERYLLTYVETNWLVISSCKKHAQLKYQQTTTIPKLTVSSISLLLCLKRIRKLRK